MRYTLSSNLLDVHIPQHLYTPGHLEFEIDEGIRGLVEGTITVHEDGTATLTNL